VVLKALRGFLEYALKGGEVDEGSWAVGKGGKGKGKEKGKEREVGVDGVMEGWKDEGYLIGSGDWGLEKGDGTWELGRLDTTGQLGGDNLTKEGLTVCPGCCVMNFH
jgi:hypothetical protein